MVQDCQVPQLLEDSEIISLIQSAPFWSTAKTQACSSSVQAASISTMPTEEGFPKPAGVVQGELSAACF